jgi:hypothetical protein
MDARLQALFDVAGHTNTAAILKIADAIARGENTAGVLLEAPAVLRAALKPLNDQTIARAATLLAWAMHIQNTATLREVERKRQLSNISKQFISEISP